MISPNTTAMLTRVSGSVLRKRWISSITNTHKHLTRRVIVQQHGNSYLFSNSLKSSQATAANKTVTGKNSFSNSSPGSQASSALRKRNPTSTLGFEAADNTSITNPVKSENGEILRVKISQRAAQKLNDIKAQDKNDDQVLRIAVESGGCHGYQYILGLKSESNIDLTEDTIFERDGAKFVIDATSLEILRDSTIDYTTELIGSQFKVVNSPYATSSCGCGSSFDFDPSALAK